MPEPATDLLRGSDEAPEPDDEAFRQVRERVHALISAARSLSDTCADLADALRPAPGQPDDPLVVAFGRLRAERTAALLDEAASAARGTLGLLQSAYGALERRPGPPAPRSGTGTWPDAFVEVPGRSVSIDEETGTAMVRPPWGPARPAPAEAGDGGLRTEPVGAAAKPPAEATEGLRAFAEEPGGAEPGPDEIDGEGLRAWAVPAVPDRSANPWQSQRQSTTPEPVRPEAAPAQDAATQDATTQDATTESAAAENAMTPDPTAQDPTAQDPTVEDSAAESPAAPDADAIAEDPTAQEVTAEDRTAENDAAPDVTDVATAEDVTAQDEPEADEPTVDEPTVDELTATAPDEATQAEAAPVEAAPAEAAPAEPTATAPDEATQAEVPLAETTLADATPAEAAPAEAAPAELTATAPDEATQVEVTAIDATPDEATAPDEATQTEAPVAEAAEATTEVREGPAATVDSEPDAANEPPSADDRPAAAPVQDEATADAAQEPDHQTELADGTSVEDTDADDPERITSAALAGWIVVDPDDATETPHPLGPVAGDPGFATADPVAAAATASGTDEPAGPEDEPATGLNGFAAAEAARVYAATATPPRLDVQVDDPTQRPGPDQDTTAGHGIGPDQAIAAGHGTEPGQNLGPGQDPGPGPGPGPSFAAGQPVSAGHGTGEAAGESADRGGDRDPFGPLPDDGAGWHGDTVSAEPRSLSLVPPVPDGPEAVPPVWGDDRMPAAADPYASQPADPWRDDPFAGADLSGAATFARVEKPVWTAEPVLGSSVAGDGVAVFPIGAATPAAAPEPAAPEVPLDEPAAATIARQVEAARRHLQAALVVANGPAAPQQLGAVLTAIEQVLTAVTDLARETRGLLESGLADRTFPGEARFLCSPPWDGTALVGRDAYGDDVASPAGLAKLLRALGYEARSTTATGGAATVQVRDDRFTLQVALVEPAGGGRQRWSGALEWVDGAGHRRSWAETVGPVELEDEELARRVDELLRRCVGS